MTTQNSWHTAHTNKKNKNEEIKFNYFIRTSTQNNNFIYFLFNDNKVRINVSGIFL